MELPESESEAGKIDRELKKTFRKLIAGVLFALLGAGLISWGFSFLYGIAGALVSIGVIVSIYAACLIIDSLNDE